MKKRKWIVPVVVFVSVLGAVLGFIYNKNHVDIEKLKESVVKINCYDIYGNQIGTASGVFVFRNCEIVTNYHVIDGEAYEFEVVLNDGTSTRVDSVIAGSKDLDLAILWLEQHLNVEPLVPNDPRLTDTKIGDKVITISSPEGEINKISEGIYEGYLSERKNETIKTTVHISEGSNGGALFNKKGQWIGILCEDSVEDGCAIPALNVASLLNNDGRKIDLEIRDFYRTREHPVPLLSVTEVLNSSSVLEGDEVTVYGYAQHINGQVVLIAADLSGGSAAMHVNLERVSNASEVVPGKVIYATGEVFNRNGSLTVAAKALEVRGKLWVPQEQEPAV